MATSGSQLCIPVAQEGPEITPGMTHTGGRGRGLAAFGSTAGVEPTACFSSNKKSKGKMAFRPRKKNVCLLLGAIHFSL